MATVGPISTGSLGYQTTDGSGVDQATGEPVSGVDQATGEPVSEEVVVVVAEEVTGSVTDVVTEVEDDYLNLSPMFFRLFLSFVKLSSTKEEIFIMAIVCLCLAYGNYNHLFPTRITEPGNSHRFVKELAQV